MAFQMKTIHKFDGMALQSNVSVIYALHGRVDFKTDFPSCEFQSIPYGLLCLCDRYMHYVTLCSIHYTDIIKRTFSTSYSPRDLRTLEKNFAEAHEMKEK